MGKHFPFLSLSLSLQNLLCNLPQRKVVSTQLQTGYNGSQRVTTGPNGLERVPSQRVPTGSNGFEGGEEERSMTRLLSPHNYIIHIIYPKKIFYFSIHISSLSLSLSNNPRKYLYIKKILYLFIYVYIFIYL